MQPVDDYAEVADHYRRFADLEAAGTSECYREWALGLAEDPKVAALVATLPALKQQPNLVFASARWHGAPTPSSYDGLRGVLVDDWDAVRATILERSTQTNEAARCAVLLPVLGSLPGPLALLEVGVSGGLCLYPDRYSYRYRGSVEADLDPSTGSGSSPVVLPCRTYGDVPVPDRLPEVVWRAGLDLNPLDVTDPDTLAWLQTLVWPGNEDRVERLGTAAAVLAQDPPRLVQGDLLTDLPALAAEAPRDATLVVFHSAVLAYVEPQGRRAFVEVVRQVTHGRGHWISNEGPRVLPEVTGDLVDPDWSGFVTGLDGRAVATAHGHGRSLGWLAPAGEL